MNTALLLVDLQNDFFEGGALGVPNSLEIVDPIVRLIGDFNGPVVATADCHPRNTVHFDAWPVHCVKGTRGADLKDEIQAIVPPPLVKGTSPDDDAYSAFEAHTRTSKPLSLYLSEMDVDDLIVAGLATDFCVKETVLDALRRGFSVSVFIDGCRGLTPESHEAALDEMLDAGATVFSRITNTKVLRGRGEDLASAFASILGDEEE